MRIQLSALRQEDGAVAVTVAMMTVLLLVIVAFTTDFGMAYAQREALATGADSAALAVVRAKYAIELGANPPQSCFTLISNDNALGSAKASTIALAQVNANAPFGATLAAADVITTLSCVSGGQVLQATVAVSRPLNPIFGSVLKDAQPIQIGRQAVAALGVVNGVSGLMPFAVCSNQATNIIAQHLAGVDVNLVSFTKVWPSGSPCNSGGGSGNWGWIDYGQGNGESALGAIITTGSTYGPLTLSTSTTPPSYTIDGTPGNKANGNAVVDGMQTIMDKFVTLPVYTTVTGNGSNAQYTVTGFLSVKMCGYAANKKTALGTCYDTTTTGVQVTGDDMQVRYVGYSPVGELGTACGIGQPCAFNAYVTKLLG